ncbi:MAG: hypothetical protein AB7F96_15510 [Beijerinckiaceae bacterium]
MTKRRDGISRPDRRVAAQIETLAFMFDMSVSQMARMLAQHGIAGSDRFGPTVYRVDTVENAIFGLDSPATTTPHGGDRSVGAVHAAKKDHRRADAA